MPTASSSLPTVPFGVRIAGSGSCVPDQVLTNHDLEQILDTSDEWIVQRTGISERRIVNPEKENTFSLSVEAVRHALNDAGMKPEELDMIVMGTVTAEMTCPSNACRIADTIGAAPAGAFDLVAACSGFVYSLNVGEALIRSGRYRNVAVIGCDTMSTIVDYDDRSVSILFGDAAGSVILSREDADPSVGCLYQSMNADGHMWPSLYIPRRCVDVPKEDMENPIRLGNLRMNGREVYKFAVTKFREVIEGALAETGLAIDDIAQFVCHQSNIRIIEAAKEKIGLPDEKVHINIDRYGNSSAGSVGLCFDQVWQAGKIKRGDHVVLVAFGGGLTWASSVWKV